MKPTLAILVLAIATSLTPVFALADPAADAAATRADIQATFGAVPTFISAIADTALPGLWQLEKSLELSEDTALDVKTKALISLAVAAQIPCDYCIFADTAAAKRGGATDQQIAEAVAMAGLTRNFSTILHGMQVDLPTFKAEMGGM